MKIIKLSFLSIFIGLLLISHATPEMAIRWRVFFIGHPISAIKADIVPYEYSNNQLAELDNSQGFEMINPPIERATQGELDTYIVSKKWLFYFARFERDI